MQRRVLRARGVVQGVGFRPFVFRLAAVATPGARRESYPFTSCTECGPRYTIARGVPFDRALTSLERFPHCAECRREYDDPRDRRFHAETQACPRCGPAPSVALAEA